MSHGLGYFRTNKSFSFRNIFTDFTFSMAMYNWQLTIYLNGRAIYFSRKIFILHFMIFFPHRRILILCFNENPSQSTVTHSQKDLHLKKKKVYENYRKNLFVFIDGLKK